MDASNLYVALDQSLNHFGFGRTRAEEKGRTRNISGNNNWKQNANSHW